MSFSKNNTDKKTVTDPDQWLQRVKPLFVDKLIDLQLNEFMHTDLDRVYAPLASWIFSRFHPFTQTQVIGINGAQGAGKSTFCELLKLTLEKGFGLKVAVLSIDDLYLSRLERKKLANTVHPLLVTRGVPGTHDIGLGIETIRSLSQAHNKEITLIPRFDKATDEVLPTNKWEKFTGRADVILFEGWCVGALPQPDTYLDQPVNQLEQNEDTNEAWRRFANWELKHKYTELFGFINFLIMLKVPSFDSVFQWRKLQEERLRQCSGLNGSDGHIMDDNQLQRFIDHYERLTRYMLDEMPKRADLVYEISSEHRICETTMDHSLAEIH